MSTTPSKRLFLALWPDIQVRAQLTQICTLLNAGRRINPANLHLTLVFLGATQPAQQACYEHVLAQIKVPGFELHINQLGYWCRSGIVWLAPKIMPPELFQLVGQLKSVLQDCNFMPEKRPFKAHITLARKFPASAWPLPATPYEIDIYWRINRFALLESVFIKEGVQYQEIAAWNCQQFF